MTSPSSSLSFASFISGRRLTVFAFVAAAAISAAANEIAPVSLSPTQSIYSMVMNNAGEFRQGSNVLPAPGSADASAAFGSGSAGASLSIALEPSPRVGSEVSVAAGSGNTLALARSYGALTYFFEIVGPDGFVPLQVDAISWVEGTLTGTNFSSASASAQLQIAGPNVGVTPSNYLGSILSRSMLDFLNPANNTADITGTSGGFEISDIYMAKTNAVYAVMLSTSVALQTGFTAGSSGTMTAWVDPTFQLALPGEAASQYQLRFSAGVGNEPLPSSVPDQGRTATLLGLAVLGITAVRKCR